MTRFSKSQAALEFLLTYGWAIIVTITTVIALFYFGILDVQWFMPRYCKIEPGISCIDYEVKYIPPPLPFLNPKNDLQLRIKNNIGVPIRISRVIINDFNYDENIATVYLNPNEGNDAGDPVIIVTDITADASVPLLEEGDRYSIEFTLIVENQDTGLPHRYEGYVRGKVSS